ncbi:MAG: ABC transporter ATP-binding protein [Alphaproteobacteria bacterium]
MPTLELRDICASYGDNRILTDLNLEVGDGDFVSLLGESGCGKTTTLRVVAGFLRSDSGAVLLDGEDYSRRPPNRRGFGYVFQSYALFPHLNVFDNVAFGLRQRKVAAEQIRTRVGEMLEVVGLSDLHDRLSKSLSGGQKQRVALARALVIKPTLLLFDEPLSNLDAKLRVQMRVEIRRLQQEFKITTLYVTHDQEECFSISDKVTVMNEGVIEQFDRPEHIYSQPASPFVARFVGFENFLALRHQGVEGDNHQLVAEDGSRFEASSQQSLPGERLLGAVRPEAISLEAAGSAGQVGCIGGEITFRTYLGRGYQYIVATALGDMTVNGERRQPFVTGDRVTLRVPLESMVLLHDT